MITASRINLIRRKHIHIRLRRPLPQPDSVLSGLKQVIAAYPGGALSVTKLGHLPFAGPGRPHAGAGPEPPRRALSQPGDALLSPCAAADNVGAGIVLSLNPPIGWLGDGVLGAAGLGGSAASWVGVWIVRSAGCGAFAGPDWGVGEQRCSRWAGGRPRDRPPSWTRSATTACRPPISSSPPAPTRTVPECCTTTATTTSSSSTPTSSSRAAGSRPPGRSRRAALQGAGRHRRVGQRHRG